MAFARLAEQNAIPRRAIAGQATKLNRTMHSIHYDPVHDEIIVPNRFASAVLTFRGAADGQEPPVRVIVGPKTRIVSPRFLNYDPVHGEIYVPNTDEILVFSRLANGDVAPIRVLHGNFEVDDVAIDPVHDVIAALGSLGDGRDGILIFNRTDNGEVEPRSFIGGPHTGMQGVSQIQISPEKGWIVIAQGPGGERPEKIEGYAVGVWSINDKGDVPPRWMLGGPESTLLRGRRVALVPKYKEILVADMWQNAILTFSFPEIF